MKENGINKLWWWIVIVFSLSVGCVSQSIPQKECCSHTGVRDTSDSDTKVNLDLVKKDGVTIILPTITTKDTIK
tara:strand:+ start:731 stop:952 length:222 start_codon:yes stop_codon:yes gene_type:complete